MAHGSTGATKVFGWPIFVLGGMQLLVVLDGTVAALALPRIRDALRLSESSGNWIITAYVIAFGGLMLLGGRLGDTFGRKRMFVVGVALFTLTSLLCGLAWDEASLVVGRALQGASAAIAAPTAMALVATTYAPGKARSTAFAVYAAMTGVGSVAGLIAGGALTEISWRLVFLINIPIGVFVVVGGIAFLVESQGERLALDIPGAILVTVGASLLVFAVNEGPGGWVRPMVLVPAILAVVVLIAFYVVERSAANPVLPFEFFRDSSRVAVFASILLAGALLMCMAVYIALYLQGILDYSPLKSGLSVVPFAFGLAVGATLASRLAQTIGCRWIVLIGGASILPGCLYAAHICTRSPNYFPDILIPVVAIGFGVGMSSIPLTLSAVAGVKVTEIGPMTAIVQVLQNLGGGVGLVIVGAFVTSKTLAEGGTTRPVAEMNDAQLFALSQGYSVAFVSAAVIAVIVGAVVMFVRYTPEQVAEGQQAQEAAAKGVEADLDRVGG
ncbi:MFS transporter [Williamsia sp. CHRR-6]|nr:MFS transporter [Williamsia sp. CHRR-6]